LLRAPAKTNRTPATSANSRIAHKDNTITYRFILDPLAAELWQGEHKQRKQSEKLRRYTQQTKVDASKPPAEKMGIVEQPGEPVNQGSPGSPPFIVPLRLQIVYQVR